MVGLGGVKYLSQKESSFVLLILPAVKDGGSGASDRVVFSSPASGILSPPSNIPNTLTEYLVPALRWEKHKSVNNPIYQPQKVNRSQFMVFT